MKFMPSRPLLPKLIIGLLVLLLVIVSLQNILAQLATGHLRIDSLRTVYIQQYANLDDPLRLLGVSDHAIDKANCVAESTGHFSTTVECQIAKSYPPNALLHPLSVSALQAYPAAAARLDSLLSQNNWTNDSPASTAQTVASIQTNLPAVLSHQTVLDVSYHKNMGDTSCDLVVSFDKNHAVDANYQCAEKFVYPGAHI